MKQTPEIVKDDDYTTPRRPDLLAGLSSSTLVASSELGTMNAAADAAAYAAAPSEKQVNIFERTDDDAATIYGSDEEVIGDGLEVDEFPDGGWKAYTVVFGSFIGLIADFGYGNSIGSIETEVATNVLSTTPSSTISWIFALYLGLTYGGNILCGAFFDRYGAKKPMILGSILMCGSIFITANCTKVWHFVLGLGVVGGIGTSLCMTPLVGVISHWFLVNRSLATGLATAGGSVGGIIFPVMLRSLFPKVGFAWSMRILGFVCLACMSISALLIKERYRTPGRGSYFANLIDFKSLKDMKYVSVICGLFMTELSLMTTLTYISSYAISKGYSQSQGLLLITIYNGAGIPARWVCGLVADKLGNFNIMVFTTCIVALFNFIMWYPFGSNIVVLYVFTGFYGFFTSSVLTLNPVCCAQICNIRDFGKRYSTMYFFVAIGNIFGIPIGGALVGDGGPIKFDHLVIYTSTLSTVGAATWVVSRYLVGGAKLLKKV